MMRLKRDELLDGTAAAGSLYPGGKLQAVFFLSSYCHSPLNVRCRKRSFGRRFALVSAALVPICL